MMPSRIRYSIYVGKIGFRWDCDCYVGSKAMKFHELINGSSQRVCVDILGCPRSSLETLQMP